MSDGNKIGRRGGKAMNKFLAPFFVVWLPLRAFAEPSPAAVNQLRADLMVAMRESISPGAARDAAGVVAPEAEKQVLARFPGVVTYTPAELERLAGNESIVTDADVQTAFQNLKNLAGNRPLPLLVTFYKAKYDRRELNAMQTAIFFRLTSEIARISAAGG